MVSFDFSCNLTKGMQTSINSHGDMGADNPCVHIRKEYGHPSGITLVFASKEQLQAYVDVLTHWLKDPY